MLKTTENKTTPTPLFDAINNIAVDNGYAEQKIAFWTEGPDGKKSIAQISYPSRAQMGHINISLDGTSSGLYTVDDENWTVGKDVAQPEVVRGTRYGHSDLNTLLVKHSLVVAGYAGKKVRISTGLPYGDFYKDGAKNEPFLEKVRKALAETEVRPKDGAVMAEVADHVVYPESIAAFLDYAVDVESGAMNKQITNGIVIVDIGGNTTDISTINPDYSIDDAASGTKKIGVLDVRSELKKLVLNKFGIDDIKDAQLDAAIRTSKCVVFGEEHDVSAELNKARKTVLKKLMNFVEELIGDGSGVDKIIFVGGGAAVLREAINDYPHAHVPNSPEFANARGMLLNLTYVQKASKQPAE